MLIALLSLVSAGVSRLDRLLLVLLIHFMYTAFIINNNNNNFQQSESLSCYSIAGINKSKEECLKLSIHSDESFEIFRNLECRVF